MQYPLTFLYKILFFNVGVEFIRPEFCGFDKSNPYSYPLNATRYTLIYTIHYSLTTKYYFQFRVTHNVKKYKALSLCKKNLNLKTVN